MEPLQQGTWKCLKQVVSNLNDSPADMDCFDCNLRLVAHKWNQIACEQAPGGASTEQTFGTKRSALAPPGACSQARNQKSYFLLQNLDLPSFLVKRNATIKIVVCLVFLFLQPQCKLSILLSYSFHIFKRKNH